MADFLDISALRKTNKPSSAADIARSDLAAEKHGFVDREPKKQRGRRKSERTGQVHAKVLPHVSEEIAEEAARRGVTQGVIIEEAWALYLENRG